MIIISDIVDYCANYLRGGSFPGSFAHITFKKKGYLRKDLKEMKRILAFILAAFMIMSTFAACGDPINENPEPDQGGVATAAPAVSGDIAPEEPPAGENGEVIPQNPNPSNGETWNGYDISFVEENGIEYVWENCSNETKANLAAAMNAIRDMTGFIPLAYPLEDGEARGAEVYDFIQLVLNCSMDYPYVLNRFLKHDNDGDGKVDAMTALFNLDIIASEEQAWDMTAKLNAKLDEIVSGMPDGSEYDKLMYLHEALVFNCKYSEEVPTFYTAYGALVDGMATCQGYADAMHMLLSRAGFETVFCIGRGNNASVTHKWNYVKLSDGQWYIIDPTWADPADKDDPAYINYDYFLISDEELLKDHKEKFENPFFTEPVASSMEHCYHITEGYYCTTYDEAKAVVSQQIKDCDSEGRHYVYLRLSDESVFEDVRDRMLKANRDDGSHGEIMQLIADNGPSFNSKSWSVYNGHEEGTGPLTFIITLKDAE